MSRKTGILFFLLPLALCFFNGCANYSENGRMVYRNGVLSGVRGVYDDISAETPQSSSALCFIDMTHPDSVRRSSGHAKHLEDMRARFSSVSGIRCAVVHYTQIDLAAVNKTNFQALVINAIDKKISDEYKERIVKIIRETRLPVLGICGGVHLVAEAFGGKTELMRRLRPGEADPRPSYYPGIFKECGFLPVKVKARDPLFAGLPDTVTVREVHAFRIKSLPSDFEVLASTDACPVQAIKLKDRLIYGDAVPSGELERLLSGWKAYPAKFLQYGAAKTARLNYFFLSSGWFALIVNFGKFFML